MIRIQLHKFAWGVLAFDVLVIVWGAFVRGTGSGAGCGSHWPDCNGEVIPYPQRIETLIELTHRLTSGMSLVLVLALFFWALASLAKGHPARKAAAAALAFTVLEAIIGAGLVLFGWVEKDASAMRGIVMAIHLVNTLGLLGSLVLTAWFATGNRRLELRGQGVVGTVIGFGIAGIAMLSASGAVAALGNTLFPPGSLVEGLRQDFDPASHVFVRLRIFHPLIAMMVGLFLVLAAGLLMHLRPSEYVNRWSRAMVATLFGQMVFGMLTLLLHAPTWMALGHLILADLLWVFFVLFAVEALAEGVPRIEAAHIGLVPDGSRATVRDYVALTKPRVISLLLFTTIAAMFIAAGGWPRPEWLPDALGGALLLIAVAIGGYASAGASNAINMVIDRDIDVKMGRTATRPTVTQRITSRNALLFAFALEALSFALLWGAANLLTAVLAFAGLVCYVIVYTLWLKRRTWSNIVIGGAAGAFPPLVGWAAVTGDLGALALILFGIIFVWTPVHFWALALLIRDEYASAGVPMLPVVRGVRATVRQIAGYAAVTVVISVLPVLLGETSWLYFVSAIALNAVLVLRCVQLYMTPDNPRAGSLFKYSMVYLALLFLAMAVDRTVV